MKSTQKPRGSLVDAPDLDLNRMSAAQREGRSCAWCSDWASDRYPIPILSKEATLRACETCGPICGITPVEADR